METTSFYSEDILIEKMQDGEYGWLDYVNHHSHEWQEEYAAYCEQHSLPARARNNSSIIKTHNWKPPWKAATHNP